MTQASHSITAALIAVPVILVVGNLRSWKMSGRILPRIEGFHFTSFHDLTGETLTEVQPDLVLSPLMGENFDAVDIARRLQALRFGGAYRAVTNDLPNPRGVVAELRSVAPGLDVDLFMLSRLRPM